MNTLALKQYLELLQACYQLSCISMNYSAFTEKFGNRVIFNWWVFWKFSQPSINWSYFKIKILHYSSLFSKYRFQFSTPIDPIKLRFVAKLLSCFQLSLVDDSMIYQTKPLLDINLCRCLLLNFAGFPVLVIIL